MFRKPAWRNTVSDAVGFHQDQALNTTIFLLKSYGPTGFLLKEEGEARNFKVCLGDPHTCSCPVFIKEQEPCKHICWVLLRKFRLPREHEYSFQHGLVERQISEVLHGLHQTKANRMENDSSVASGTSSQPDTNQEAGSVCRKVIQAQDVCPICQEELLEKKQPVSYCRFGCGNNVHISCMKVWADHQKLSDREETVKCPLCREDFGSLKLLQEQVKNAAKLFAAAEREKPGKHLGVLCNGCHVCPITGKCFKCIVCSYFYLCEDCSKKGCHPQHQFASRTKRGDKWHFVAEDLRDEPKGAASQSANDSIIPVAADLLPENVLGCLPTVRVRSGSVLLDEGQQCRICLQNFTLGHRVRTLPCNHKFHMDCVDGILRKLNSCPLDGYVIYNPLTWRTSERKTSHKLASCLSDDFAKPEHGLKDLFIPGVALRDRNSKTAPSHGSLNLEVVTGSSDTLNIPHKLKTDAVTKGGEGVLHKKQGPVSDFDSGHRQNTRSSKKTLAKRSPVSPNLCLTGAKIGEYRRQVDLFVGLHRPERGHTATVACPARGTRLLPKKVPTQDTTKKLTSELRMTGVLINTQHHRKTDT
ncbi:E3 ubiquitin-protein ligase ZSWIM2 [Seriola lalandi dorsalis]|uniref:E3 ubiquitin-protein ligase ZSWIM2 n=1 Tax=Seriola lalandi dorsalis TaxID=1841481 RepID=UPI000C6FBAAE|nr:E3 ubiquitin-protein ligase ZSWIM2 [Seriola lalandi dorsalis]